MDSIGQEFCTCELASAPPEMREVFPVCLESSRGTDVEGIRGGFYNRQRSPCVNIGAVSFGSQSRHNQREADSPRACQAMGEFSKRCHADQRGERSPSKA